MSMITIYTRFNVPPLFIVPPPREREHVPTGSVPPSRLAASVITHGTGGNSRNYARNLPARRAAPHRQLRSVKRLFELLQIEPHPAVPLPVPRQWLRRQATHPARPRGLPLSHLSQPLSCVSSFPCVSFVCQNGRSFPAVQAVDISWNCLNDLRDKNIHIDIHMWIDV